MTWDTTNLPDELPGAGDPLENRDINQIVTDLINNVGLILEYKSRLALGKPLPPGADKYCPEEMDRLVELAKPIIQGYQYTRKLHAKSTQEIIVMLRAGDITLAEAKTLMGLVSDTIALRRQEASDELLDNVQGLLTMGKV